MLDTLLLNTNTKSSLVQVLKNSPHFILLVGPAGSGKKTIANILSSTFLDIEQDNLDQYPYFYRIKPQTKSEVSIDQVRELIKILRLKTPGNRQIRRVVYFENAARMSIEAQNALLKVLEEPGSDTVFILGADSTVSIMPTVVSRAQTINIQTVSQEDARKYFGKKFPKKLVDVNWHLSNGSVGLLNALLENDSEHSLKQVIEKSKDFLPKDNYERLTVTDALSKDKEEFQLFLESLKIILRALHRHALEAGPARKADSLLWDRKLLNRLSLALEQNTAPKLVSLKLVTNLRV